MSADGSKRDVAMRWLRRGFWIVLSLASVLVVVAVIFIVPAFLMGCLFALLCWRWPFLSGISMDWVVLVSSAMSLVLIGVFIYLDTRKWHIGETLRRLCEYDKHKGFKK